MTRPNNRPASRRASASDARLAASLSGAVDLSGIKDRADAQKRAPEGGGAASAGNSAGASGAPAAPGSTSLQVNEQNFETEVLQRSMQVPVLVELGSSRAPTAMTSTLSRLAAEDGGTWVHAYCDVDQSPGIAQAFRAQGVPMVIAVAGGRPLTDFEGEQPEDQLRLVIDKILEVTAGKLEGPVDGAEQPDAAEGGEPEDPERDAAENALAEGDLPLAEERFRSLVDARPGDHGLLEALRFVQVSRRVAEEKDPVAEGMSEDAASALSSADLKIMAGSYADAFEAVVSAIRVSAGDEKNALRNRLLELLETLPANDADVLAARRNLATALY
ncbi:tetratricopeptide repeat protein [Dietzia sp.]|uniref:tetratricopeptide repeat protein n=1 Tax=Dietzia sp. TaxID=1871616 RepID=UPI002FDAD3B6